MKNFNIILLNVVFAFILGLLVKRFEVYYSIRSVSQELGEKGYSYSEFMDRVQFVSANHLHHQHLLKVANDRTIMYSLGVIDKLDEERYEDILEEALIVMRDYCNPNGEYRYPDTLETIQEVLNDIDG